MLALLFVSVFIWPYFQPAPLFSWFPVRHTMAPLVGSPLDLFGQRRHAWSGVSMVTAAVTRLHQRERLPAISPSMSGGPRPVGPSGVAVTTVTSGASLELTSDPGRAQAASALSTVPAAWPRHGCKEPRLLPSTNCVRSLKLDLKPKKKKRSGSSRQNKPSESGARGSGSQLGECRYTFLRRWA